MRRTCTALSVSGFIAGAVAGLLVGTFLFVKLPHRKQALSSDPIVEAPAAAVRATSPALTKHSYPFTLLRVVDGDTIDGEWLIWQDLRKSGRLRLLGVNTPELHPRSGTAEQREAEKVKALAAKAYVETSLQAAASITLVTDWSDDSFGRILAEIHYLDDSHVLHDLSADLLLTGHAVPFVK